MNVTGNARHVYEFRPKDEGPWLRYADGTWIPDDGEWDIAFITPPGCYGAPFALYVEVAYWSNIEWSWQTFHPTRWHYQVAGQDWGERFDDTFRPLHPNSVAMRKAMDKCASIHHCANGRGPKFYVDDPYIKARLVRVRETREIVTAPAFPECFKCRNNEDGHRTDEYRQQREDLRDNIQYVRAEIARQEAVLADYHDALDALERESAASLERAQSVREAL